MGAYIESLGRGRWKLRADVWSGNSRRRFSRVFVGGKREAQAALRAFEAECSARPLEVFLLPAWMRSWSASRLAAGLIEENTHNQYMWAARVLDGVLNIPVADVTPAKVREALARVQDGVTPSGRPLSSKSTASLVKCCRAAYDEAVRDRLAPCNPFSGVSVGVKTKPRRALSVVEAGALLERLSYDSPCAFAASLILRTGLRASEALGVQWRDVSDVISVRREITKTDAGVRVVPLSEADLDFVDERRQFLERRLAKSGGALEGSDRLCCGNDGRPLSYNALRLWWARHREALGVGDLVLHELRHSYLSGLAQAGVHPSVMQRLAGHSSMAVTLEIYTHAQDSDLRAAVSALSSARDS